MRLIEGLEVFVPIHIKTNADAETRMTKAGRILIDCLFTKDELANSTPSGKSTKERMVKQLCPKRKEAISSYLLRRFGGRKEIDNLFGNVCNEKKAK